MTVPESDEELMLRFVNGEGAAFDVLFARHAGPLRGYLGRLVGAGAAEDLTQTTFLSLLRARSSFQRDARFKPWLYAIATNAARDLLRRRRPEELTPRGDLPAGVAASVPAPRDLGLEAAVHAALAQLPAAQREAIVLHRFEGFSFAEIAETLEVGESAVKVRAHRGYTRLRELLRHAWSDA